VIKTPGPVAASERLRERWVRTVRAEVTDRMLIAGPRHLRTVLDRYVTHYNRRRPHRARNLRPPDYDGISAAPIADLAAARIRRRKVLGRLIHEHERAG
jgi:putative transposase